MQSKKSRNISGWINFNKSKGITSAKAVSKIKKFLNVNKVGHAGTLDPMATGVLPIAIGEATKTVSYFMEGEKTYKCIASWGNETATDDAEGEIISTSNIRPSMEQINNLLNDFKGIISQKPPNYSAIKINGKRAYKIARSGGVPSLVTRKVKVLDFKLLKIIDEDTAEFFIKCEKGTYVRSLIRDLGRKLGVLAHLKELHRCSVGNFNEKKAISLDIIQKVAQSSAENNVILPIQIPLGKMKEFEVSENYSKKLINGIKIPIEKFENYKKISELKDGEVFYTVFLNNLIAICIVESGMIKPKRVFNG